MQRVGNGRDPLFKGRQHVGAAAGGIRDLLDPDRERAHFLRQLAQRVVRGDMGDDAAQGENRALELLQGRRVVAAGGNAVDLVGEPFHSLLEADQVLGRRQRAQGIAHLGEAALQSGNGGAARDASAAPAVVQPVRERSDLFFQRLHRPPRHRLLQHQPDFGEIVAQRLDRGVEPRPQRLDPVGDVAKLVFQARQALRRGARQVGARRVSARFRSRFSSACWRAEISISA